MAIVSVLWSLALLSAVTVSLLSTGNVSYQLTHNAVQVAQDDTLNEAALNRTILALLDPRPPQRLRLDGVAQDLMLYDLRIRVAVQDELGRIDLNHADAPLFIALFQSVGVDTAAAGGLADKILDWRDRTPLKRLNGAKEREYRDAGFAYGPRNGPFQSVDELRLVMGMTPELFRRAAPALTVYSGRPRFDPQVAPREALLALRAMNDANVDALMANRMQRDPTEAAGIGDPITALKGRAYTIRSEIQIHDRAITRETVVRLTGNPEQPYWVLNWRQR